MVEGIILLIHVAKSLFSIYINQFLQTCPSIWLVVIFVNLVLFVLDLIKYNQSNIFHAYIVRVFAILNENFLD